MQARPLLVSLVTVTVTVAIVVFASITAAMVMTVVVRWSKTRSHHSRLPC